MPLYQTNYCPGNPVVHHVCLKECDRIHKKIHHRHHPHQSNANLDDVKHRTNAHSSIRTTPGFYAISVNNNFPRQPASSRSVNFHLTIFFLIHNFPQKQKFFKDGKSQFLYFLNSVIAVKSSSKLIQVRCDC